MPKGKRMHGSKSVEGKASKEQKAMIRKGRREQALDGNALERWARSGFTSREETHDNEDS